jgi:hypothetical protein
MLLASHNRNVERTFFGVNHEDLSSTQGGMKLACLLQDDDTVDMFLLRMYLYYFVFQGNLPTPIYGIPVPDYDSEIVYKPQVKLIFKEDWNALLMENGLNRAKAEISFRLMHETSASMNHGKAEAIALKVKEFFGLENGFTFEKGPIKVTYIDKHNGINFILAVVSEAEAVRVIERVLELANVPFNESFIRASQSRKTYPQVPGFHEVYGREKRKPRERPTTRVRFRKAELDVWGNYHPITLLDLRNPSVGLVSIP